MKNGKNFCSKNDAFFGKKVKIFEEILEKSGQPVENCWFA
jgi:hypothetical protein